MKNTLHTWWWRGLVQSNDQGVYSVSTCSHCDGTPGHAGRRADCSDQGKSRWVEVAATVFLETVYTWLLATVRCSWLPSRQYYTTFTHCDCNRLYVERYALFTSLFVNCILLQFYRIINQSSVISHTVPFLNWKLIFPSCICS